MPGLYTAVLTSSLRISGSSTVTKYYEGGITVDFGNIAAGAQAVESALPNMRFSPAEIRGTRVKQLMQEPFSFSLSKR